MICIALFILEIPYPYTLDNARRYSIDEYRMNEILFLYNECYFINVERGKYLYGTGKGKFMDKKIIVFICALLAVVVMLSSWTIMEKRGEKNIKESKLEPAVKNFIEIFNNVDDPEYKTLYWEMISQTSKDKLIQQTGSLDAAQREVWIMLQGVADAQRKVEYLGMEHLEIEGNVATVLIRVRITEAGQEPLETTTYHKYRWENGEWKFIDWLIEPEAYQSVGS